LRLRLVGRPGQLAAMLAAICVCLMSASSASAETFSSSYTSIEPEDCRTDRGGTRVCPGKAGLVVLVSEDDLRETVSIGRDRGAAAREPAARTWFGPFNSATAALEWRAAGGTPFAVIQRWRIADIDDEDKTGRPISKEMLVVTRLPPGAVCHVAYVDVKANSNSNELARQAADTIARNFKCDEDKVKIVGATGRAVELATMR
jgi:hypothetical protein